MDGGTVRGQHSQSGDRVRFRPAVRVFVRVRGEEREDF